MDEVVKEFLVESHENLDQLDRDLLRLEEDPADAPTIASIFRTIHTIKGTSGFLGLGKLEKLTHVGESLLSRLRDGALAMTAEIASALLATTDAVRAILAAIEADGSEGTGDYSDLMVRLQRLNDGTAPAPSRSAPAPTAELTAPPPAPAARAPEPPEAALAVAAAPEETDERRALHSQDLGDLLVAAGKVTRQQLFEASQAQLLGDRRLLGEILVARGHVNHDDLAEALSKQRVANEKGAPKNQVADTSIRVGVELLDKLMNLVGELVLARNQVLQYSASQDDSQFIQTTQRLNLITTELQEGVMKTRMQPIGSVWSKFPRVVRDLALACEKRVRLDLEGKETELDRTLIDAIKDPLTHIVRNSIDHGIENPAARRAAGKPEEGTLLLRAFHEGGQVNIEISDDGAGIALDRVKEKASSKGLITPEHAARMSDREAINLVFLPGFSTAAAVTNISGRGVGMDVVKSNIEKIGGTVDITSRQGQGTTLRIKIPLTLAIIPALIVMSGGERFAIPQVSLVELVRLDGKEAAGGIEDIHGSPVYRLRGRLLPLVDLNRLLGVGEPAQATAGGSAADLEVNIVVLQAEGRQFGLVVEKIHDTEEIVVKPLGKQMKNLNVFAGATIMGDGKVALILDVLGVAQRSNVVSEIHDAKRAAVEVAAEEQQSVQPLLLFTLGDDCRMAVPLAQVARLEEFARTAIEHTGDREVIQYRGDIMPLFYVRDLLPERRLFDRGAEGPDKADGSEKVQVVVYAHEGRSIGLVVARILDIVKEGVSVRREATRMGVVESVVVQGRVTEVLDVPHVIEAARQRQRIRMPVEVGV